MGCFLGCFGGAKDHKRRKQRVHRASPQRQRNRVQNVQPENAFTAGVIIPDPQPTTLAPDLQSKPEREEQQSASPKRRVTFNSNITAYEPVPVHESVDSLWEHNINVEDEKQESLQKSSQSHSVSEGNNSVTSSVRSYPPNHRYHNSRDSDDEADEEYGDGDLDDFDDENDYDDYDEDIDVRIASQEVWSESVLTASMESRTENPSSQATDEEVESPLVKNQSLHQEIMAFGSKAYSRDRSDYINSVLNPVENITQWKAAKSKGVRDVRPSKPQKENLTANFEAPCEYDQYMFKSRSDQKMNANQEIAVDASLSNWLVSPEVTSCKNTKSSGLEVTASGKTASEGCISVSSFEDRPILGALTVEELRQISASPSLRKSPSRSPDEMPIVGTVGTYWNDMALAKHCDPAASYKGIPNTTSKYREDTRVNWHSTPFETRLERALNRGAAEA